MKKILLVIVVLSIAVLVSCTTSREEDKLLYIERMETIYDTDLDYEIGLAKQLVDDEDRVYYYKAGRRKTDSELIYYYRYYDEEGTYQNTKMYYFKSDSYVTYETTTSQIIDNLITLVKEIYDQEEPIVISESDFIDAYAFDLSVFDSIDYHQGQFSLSSSYFDVSYYTYTIKNLNTNLTISFETISIDLSIDAVKQTQLDYRISENILSGRYSALRYSGTSEDFGNIELLVAMGGNG